MISDCAEVHMESWLKLAAEEGKKRPLQYALKRATQMKAEQAISEVLCWGREPGYVRRLAMRKEQIFLDFLGDNLPPYIPSIIPFMDMLAKHNVFTFHIKLNLKFKLCRFRWQYVQRSEN